MGTYSGLAAIIFENDAEIAVVAALRTTTNGLRSGWSGTLTAPAESAVKLLNVAEGTLRLADGSEGGFICPDPSEWFANSAHIEGSDGTVPF